MNSHISLDLDGAPAGNCPASADILTELLIERGGHSNIESHGVCYNMNCTRNRILNTVLSMEFGDPEAGVAEFRAHCAVRPKRETFQVDANWALHQGIAASSPIAESIAM